MPRRSPRLSDPQSPGDTLNVESDKREKTRGKIGNNSPTIAADF